MGLIETFLLDKLLDKLANAIINAKPSPHSTYLSQLHKECTDLKTKVEKTNNPKVRETLYRLNNETHRSSSFKTLPETLKKIKNDLLIPKKDDNEWDPKSKTTSRWSTRIADPTAKIPGFEDRAMERMLVDGQRFKSFGIFGMAGVGKTTLCQVLFGNRKVRDHFFPRIWVCMPSGRTEKDEVARRMLTCLGFEDKYADRLGNRAVEQQLKGRKCLVVLDNVDDDEVASPLPFLKCGKVIVTSRSGKAAGGIVGKKNLHELLAVVDKERCWEIFMGEAEKDGCWERFMEEAKKCYGNEGKKDGDEKEEDENEKNGKIKVEIVESFNGLPLVAKMKGQILHDQQYISK